MYVRLRYSKVENSFREIFPYYLERFSIAAYLLYLAMVTIYSMLTMFIVDSIIKTIRKEKKNYEQNNHSYCAGES